MTIALFPGASVGMYYPPLPRFNSASTPALAGPTLDQTSDNVTFVGRHINKDHANKTVAKIHVNLGAISDAGATGDSTVTVTVETVDTTTGPPFRTPGTTTLINGITGSKSISALTANAWNEFDVTDGALNFRQRCAVKIAFTTLPTSDSIVVRGLSLMSVSAGYSGFSNNVTGSQAIVDRFANVVFEYTDGSYGTLSGAFPLSAASAVALASNATQEAGLEFVAPMSCHAYGATFYGTHGQGTANLKLALYGDGATPAFTDALADTEDMDGNTTGNAVGTNQWLETMFQSPAALVAGNTYRVVVRGTTTNAGVAPFYYDLGNAAFRQCHPMGATTSYVSRATDGGAFTSVTTRLMPIALLIFPDEAAGGGGAVGSIYRSSIGE